MGGNRQIFHAIVFQIIFVATVILSGSEKWRVTSPKTVAAQSEFFHTRISSKEPTELEKGGNEHIRGEIDKHNLKVTISGGKSFGCL